jgi:3-phosphoshikimate 1-carboxyvinyltransferase
MIQKIEPCLLSGEVLIPASKSDAQRALLAASLCEGRSEIYNVGRSNDVLAMLDCIEQIGATVIKNKNSVSIIGVSRFPQKANFNCGESGLTFRLIAGICCLSNGIYILDGYGSLLKRKHDFIDEFGTQYGLKIQSEKGKLPYRIHGGLTTDKIVIDGSRTSQFVSGLLMGIPLLNKGIELTVLNLKSTPYVEMTIATLQKFGICMSADRGGIYKTETHFAYQAAKYVVEGDWSAASYWCIASALGHPLKIKGLNKDSLQADRRLLDLFTDYGISFERSGELILGKRPLVSFDFDATNCPDLFPSLVSYAVFCEGVSRVKGIHRLVNKESNRIATLLSEFEKVGADLTVKGDVLYVRKSELNSNTVDSFDDHRIAMCFAIVGLQLKKGISISGAAAVSKSYPDFWVDLKKLSKKNGA